MYYSVDLLVLKRLIFKPNRRGMHYSADLLVLKRLIFFTLIYFYFANCGLLEDYQVLGCLFSLL
jgi:hypothetical protein